MAQWLELRWWERYLKPLKKEDYYSKKKQYWQQILHQLELEPVVNQPILEAGCGPAGIFTILHNQKVDAIDPLLRKYTQRLTHFSPEEYPWVRFHATTLEDHSCQPYPLVFCFNAINHIANWEDGMRKLVQFTAADGRLALGVDVHKYSWLRWVFRYLPGDLLHPQQHIAEEYRAVLQKHNMTIEHEFISKKGLIFDYWIVLLHKPTST